MFSPVRQLKLIRHLTHGGDGCDDHGDGVASTLVALRQGTATKHGHSHNGIPFNHGKFIRGKGSNYDLMRHFYEVVTETTKGKLLLTIWGGFLAGLYMFTPTQKKKKEKEKKKKDIKKHGHSHGTQGDCCTEEGKGEVPDNSKKMSKKSLTLRQVGQFILSTIRPHMKSLFGCKVLFYLALLTYRIRVTVHLASITGRMGAYFGSRRWDQMFDGQVTFGLWCMVAAGTTAAMKYMEKLVALDFRSILYHKLHNQYYQQHCHRRKNGNSSNISGNGSNGSDDGSVMYTVGTKMNDIPARVTNDLKIFSNLVAHEFGHIVKPIIDMIYLITDLTNQIGVVPLVGFLSFFYWSKTALSRTRNALPITLSELSRREQEGEAQLTSNAQHVHDFREEISLQRGHQSESIRMLKVYDQLNETSRLKNLYECMLDTLRSYILKYGGAMTAFSMLIPAAYVHESNASQEDGTANYMLRSTLLMSLANAVKDLADSVNCLNELLGVGGRVISLSNLLHDTSNRSTTTTTTTVKRINNKNDIIINNLDVSVPSTTLKTLTLIKNLTATIKDGQHTVVIGPNGTGKTSLFRTLGGVWKPTNGHAIVPSNLYVMPQRPYFTWRGTLWEQVAYPNEREILAKSIKGRQMIEYWLNIVGLENIVQKRGINASDDDFHTSLSGGQQQRVMWARMFYNVITRNDHEEGEKEKKKSKFVLLDEATSAISSDWVGKLYDIAKDNNMTLISIAHDKEVEKYHDHVLSLKVGGKWNHL